MSRIAKSPIVIPDKVDVTLDSTSVKVKGSKGELELVVHRQVSIEKDEAGKVLTFKPKSNDKKDWAYAGTMRSLVNNMVIGVSQGFEKTLLLVGVGYRVQISGNKVTLSLGYSHPVEHILPPSVSAEAINQTTLKLSGADKQLVGQVAANIREYRKPEPYKGKGIKYSDEIINRKEAKKK